MVDPVTLLVPAEAPYRALGPELARKYLELAGGSASDAEALADAVAAAVAQVLSPASAGSEIALVFEHEHDSVGVQVRCGRESASVSQAVSVKK